MITLFTGAPGSGKTAALVDLLSQLVGSRPLYVCGLDGLKLDHYTLEDPTKWMETVPDGSIIVIDEVQQVWRPRGPGTKVPDHIAALETHRHRGIDFFLTTQGPNLLDANVRALVGRHVHLRDLGYLGRHWYEWPECADNCRTGFRSAVEKRRYRLPKRVFDVYKSASIHTKPIRSFPTALAIAVLALAATAYLGYRLYGNLQAKMAGSTGGVGDVLPSKASSPSPSRVPDTARLAQARRLSPSPVIESVAPTVPLGPPAPPPPAFAGCAVVRDVCACYDVAGGVADASPDACARSGPAPIAALGISEPTGGAPAAAADAMLSLIADYAPREALKHYR